MRKRNYDPLDYTSIESVDFQIVGEKPTPELIYEDIENEIYREDIITSIDATNMSSNMRQSKFLFILHE